jgi:O-antigen ligase
MSREKIDGWCEKGILGLMLGILIWGPLALGGNRVWAFLPIEAMTLGIMALWGMRFWISPKPQLLWPPICWAVAAFMIYATVRYFQADIEYAARGELIQILVYGFLFFAVLNNLHRQESIQIIGVTLIFLGMVISIYAGFQFISKSAHVWMLPTQYQGRGSGTFVYPNHMAGFMEMLVPLGMCYVLVGRLSHVTKIILGYASVVMLVGIGVTMSRGGWAVTAVMLVVLCLVLIVQRDYWIQGATLLLVLIVGGALVLPRAQFMHQRMQSMLNSGKPDDLRFAVWQPAIQMWRDNFWWGVGPAHFDYRFPEYRPTEVQLRPEWTHNDYLNTLADWGVIGTGLVAAAWLLLFWGVLRNWKFVRGSRDDFARKKSSKFAFLIGASIGLFAILLHSVVDFQMHLPANAILAVTFMALLSSQYRFATERFWFRAGPILKCAASVILLAGMTYLGYEGVRAGREYYWLRQAELLTLPPHPNNFTYAHIAALEKAFAIEPKNPATAYEIGQGYRLNSWQGADDFVPLAKKAMEWYQRGLVLNRYDAYDNLYLGMCLDWISSSPDGSKESSATYYERANTLDPNNYFITANTGWHYVQIGDFAAARTWFERSRRLEWIREDNQIAYDYLPIVESRLKEAAEKFKEPK